MVWPQRTADVVKRLLHKSMPASTGVLFHTPIVVGIWQIRNRFKSGYYKK